VADGGMGTMLQEQGSAGDVPPEAWNVEEPDRIEGIHSRYVAAGTDILLTNTFGGTRLRLAHRGLEDRATELNGAAVEIARRAVSGADRPVLVGGSMGPTGVLMEPFGPLSRGGAEEEFGAQAAALAGAGVDILWIETMSSLEEMGAAVIAAGRYGRPVVATMSFDTNGRTMMGVAPAALGQWWNDAGSPPAAIGANCGVDPVETIAAVAEIAGAASGAVLVAKSNCGRPETDPDGGTVYPVGPDAMETYVRDADAAGARIIGACCGSTPAHIAEIRRVVDGLRAA
jgi:5-methyltetrahydrofolate--homocysteine methyltransferase